MSSLVLVIEGVPPLETLLERNLRDEGIHVIRFPLDVEATRVGMDQRVEHIPDVVLLTDTLTKEEGSELVRYLVTKSRQHKMVFVLFSGRNEQLDHIKTLLIQSATQVSVASSSTLQEITHIILTYLRSRDESEGRSFLNGYA